MHDAVVPFRSMKRHAIVRLELECKQLYFPCDQILNSDAWEEALQAHAPDQFGLYMRFRKGLLNALS